MSVKLFIKDKVTDKVHEYGTNQHDCLMLNDKDGSLAYYNLQTGEGTGEDGGYTFCKSDGSYIDAKNEYESIVDIGGDLDMTNTENFGSILICAVRYALGRETYMPSIVIGFIRPLISKINNKTLFVLERDVRESKSYGDPKIDKPDWLRFLAELQSEIKNRKDGGKWFGSK